jgi:hypothetical protein
MHKLNVALQQVIWSGISRRAVVRCRSQALELKPGGRLDRSVVDERTDNTGRTGGEGEK